MVGFGSSLRMARRPGWESAYLDYEKLKLLLSQIEAVYDEIENQPYPQEDLTTQRRRDYREQLFDESDSDAAYLSVDEEEDDDSGNRVNSAQGEQQQLLLHPRTASKKPFTLTFSHEASSSDEDSQAGAGCGAGVSASLTSWASWDKTNTSSTVATAETSNNASVQKRNHHHLAKRTSSAVPSIEEEDSFYLQQQKRNQDHHYAAFYMGHDLDEQPQSMEPATPIGMISFASGGGGVVTPPSHAPPPPLDLYSPHLTPPSVPPLKHERKKGKTPRRRHKQRKKPSVPRPLRIAHAKSRAITERFLGLLRAETEKVMLFAQGRLGELAETVGSLRFSSDDTAYEYPLSDSGMHSASSSSDEENRLWSVSSDNDEDGSRGSQRPAHQGYTGTSGGDSIKPLVRKNLSKVSSQDLDNIMAVERQITHFEKLRKARPTFQRSDQILGEDMLFLSAVEEADGYTAVGVELVHVLRYICVNLLAVRKICRKHDRLLMNRMLGGYYQRARMRTSAWGLYARVDETNTLGGRVARTSGDIYNAHPTVAGERNHYKLVGVYDRMIQKLANSRTVQVVSSCLAQALSEYEITRSRADALTKLNSSMSMQTPRRSGGGPFGSLGPYDNGTMLRVDENLAQPLLHDPDGRDGPPSTASSISLTRLRFTVTSIFSLREGARRKLNIYDSYLSRSMLSFSGASVRGEGLDGCSRETVDFLVSFDPNAALLLNSYTLFRGLQRGAWMDKPIATTMTSTLAVATQNEQPNPVDYSDASLSSEELFVMNAITLLPQSPDPQHIDVVFPCRQSIPDISQVALRINCLTSFLYWMNYFVAHATTNVFVKATGAPPAHSATIIGAPNLTAILATFAHCMLITRDSSYTYPEYNVRLFRGLLAASSFFGFCGNAIHGVGIDRGSIPLALLGRLILGFSSADVVHRQIVSACLPAYAIAESARLFKFRTIGIATGLFVGALAETIPITFKSVGGRSLQATSWLMMVLWLIHCIRVIIQFREQSPFDRAERIKDARPRRMSDHSGYESDSSVSVGGVRTPSSVLYRSSSDMTPHEPFSSKYGSLEKESRHEDRQLFREESSTVPVSKSAEPFSKKTGFQQIKTFATRIRRLLDYHAGVGVSILISMYVVFGLEVFFTATPMIFSRYFAWDGSLAGTFLGLLALLIIPTYRVCAWVAQHYEERTIIKRSLLLVGVGLAIMVNWVSMFSLASKVPKLLTEIDGPRTHPYDWKLGAAQFIVGMVITFIGFTGLQSASLALLSKVSPQKIKSVFWNVGTVVTILSLIARYCGDVQILMVGLSHRLINTDIVNALVFPLCIVTAMLWMWVKNRYFFLL